MTKKKTTAISIVLFAAVFACLLITATFTDLPVSNLLTSSSLSAHTYLTDDVFGATFEAIGCAPVYMMFAFAFEILFWYFLRKKDTVSMKLLGVLAFVSTMVANYILANDTMKYIIKHIYSTDHLDGQASKGYLIGTEISVAFLISVLGILAVRCFSDESIEKLSRFAAATIVFAAVSTITIDIVKIIFGRIRYRAMNMYPDNEVYGFSAFAKWYEINGSRWNSLFTKEDTIALFGSTDCFHSFPSGHTCSAGASYGLIMLNDVLDIKSKKVRVLMWAAPMLFTATVAISRIVVGAHFFSDVLVGGTIAFVCMIIAREFIVLKGANIKALTGKENKTK